MAAKAARRNAQLRAYADRIVIWHDGEIVAEHPRRFGRGQTSYNPWHYLPVLARKPGALRNGQPFRDGEDGSCSGATSEPRLGSAARPRPDPAPPRGPRGRRPAVRRHLGRHRRGRAGRGGGGLSRGARVGAKLCGRDVVLNLLTRRRQPPAPEAVATPARLALTAPPVADCERYDRLRPPLGAR